MSGVKTSKSSFVVMFMGRSLSVDGQCENSHRTGLGRPTLYPQSQEA